MANKIIWRGNDYTNKSSRRGVTPAMIVCHVVEGSWSSCDSWFRSPDNNVSSAHFCVARDGSIRQYVDLREMAWANGITSAQMAKSKSAYVRSRSENPNLYTVSIEHEGYGSDGSLTEAQFQATVWLQRWIRDEVKRIYGYTIPLNRERIVGHYEINPVNKPSCPGPNFQWSRLMEAHGSGDKGAVGTGNKNETVYETTEGIGTVEILVPELNVRKHADLTSEVVGTVKAGTPYIVWAEKNGMWNVGGDQWVSAGTKYTRFYPNNNYSGYENVSGTTWPKVIQIVTPELNVRQYADFNSKVMKTVKSPDTYQVWAYKNGLWNVGGDQWVSASPKYTKLV